MKLNKQGERLFITSLIVSTTATVWTLLWALGHIYWTSKGYCWGTFDHCYYGGK